jgi:NAD(P)-dependent dehydrogenase (short-subunit alcohol dehydrogenase family)
VRILYGVGAHVAFGDIDAAACEELVKELTSSGSSSGGTLITQKIDVRSYEDNLKLFQAAYAKYGRVDHALSIAGVTEGQNWFEPSLDLESVQNKPSTAVLDINLLGALYFARIAAVYLRQGQKSDSIRDKSLLLTGSLASFKEHAGLFVYQPAKHGVMGLFRSIRKNLDTVHGIRVNIVCPSLISTGMASKIQHVWVEKGLPINSADQVAQYMATLTAQSKFEGARQTSLAVYVEGGKGWEFESELDKLDSQWMGEEMARNCADIIKALGIGDGWADK